MANSDMKELRRVDPQRTGRKQAVKTVHGVIQVGPLFCRVECRYTGGSRGGFERCLCVWDCYKSRADAMRATAGVGCRKGCVDMGHSIFGDDKFGFSHLESAMPLEQLRRGDIVMLDMTAPYTGLSVGTRCTKHGRMCDGAKSNCAPPPLTEDDVPSRVRLAVTRIDKR